MLIVRFANYITRDGALENNVGNQFEFPRQNIT